ncbi:hypothetical protein HKD37_02G005722 [Glycine soja]
MREMKARNAGVAIGGWDCEAEPPEALDWEEIGSVGGEAMVARESPIAAREPIERARGNGDSVVGPFGFGNEEKREGGSS